MAETHHSSRRDRRKESESDVQAVGDGDGGKDEKK